MRQIQSIFHLVSYYGKVLLMALLHAKLAIAVFGKIVVYEDACLAHDASKNILDRPKYTYFKFS